tara:strand:+ start:1667 stop:2068 length:402 start_codon:yes stop_codon:yes gene_type:complete
MKTAAISAYVASALLLASCSQGTKPPRCNEAADLTIAGQQVSTDFVGTIASTLGLTPNIEENQIKEAAQQVQLKYPEATQDETIDLLAAAYCPSIDPRGLLSAKQQETIQAGFVENVNAIVGTMAQTVPSAKN